MQTTVSRHVSGVTPEDLIPGLWNEVNDLLSMVDAALRSHDCYDASCINMVRQAGEHLCATLHTTPHRALLPQQRIKVEQLMWREFQSRKCEAVNEACKEKKFRADIVNGNIRDVDFSLVEIPNQSIQKAVEILGEVYKTELPLDWDIPYQDMEVSQALSRLEWHFEGESLFYCYHALPGSLIQACRFLRRYLVSVNHIDIYALGEKGYVSRKLRRRIATLDEEDRLSKLRRGYMVILLHGVFREGLREVARLLETQSKSQETMAALASHLNNRWVEYCFDAIPASLLMFGTAIETALKENRTEDTFLRSLSVWFSSRLAPQLRRSLETLAASSAPELPLLNYHNDLMAELQVFLLSGASFADVRGMRRTVVTNLRNFYSAKHRKREYAMTDMLPILVAYPSPEEQFLAREEARLKAELFSVSVEQLLSNREKQVLDLMGQGCDGPEISNRLGIAVGTVYSLQYRIRGKLQNPHLRTHRRSSPKV
jgi:DNA-binding CsgD family transcriptional regulator